MPSTPCYHVFAGCSAFAVGGRPCARASADTFTPGIIALATIASFADVDQRRRTVAGLASRRETFASMTWKLLCPDTGPECKTTSCTHIVQDNL